MSRPRVEQLRNMQSLTKSLAAVAALKIACGEPVLAFSDIDDEAHRMEMLIDLAKHYVDRAKGMKKLLQILATGTATEFEAYLLKRV
jgi:hypothetical protein